jgi:glycerol-3-phosphate dehydrogenase
MAFDSIKTVGVLGAGTMGNGIAHVFARAGYKVILRDVEYRFLDRAMETIGKNLDREIKKGKLPKAEKGAVLGRLQPVTDMPAIAAADFVVEAVPEKASGRERRARLRLEPRADATHQRGGVLPLQRVRGSHRIYRHADGRCVVVAYHG